MKTLKVEHNFRLTDTYLLTEVAVHRMQLTAPGCKQLVVPVSFLEISRLAHFVSQKASQNAGVRFCRSERFAASSPDILFSQLPFGTASSLLLVAPLNSDNAIISRVVANQALAEDCTHTRVLQDTCEPTKFACRLWFSQFIATNYSFRQTLNCHCQRKTGLVGLRGAR